MNTRNFEKSQQRLIQKRRKKNAVTFSVGLGDLILINIAIMIGYYLRFHLELGVGTWIQPHPVAPISPYLKALVFIDYAFLVLFMLFKLYRRERSRSSLDETHAILKSLLVGFFMATSLTFFIRVEGFEYSRIVFFYSFLLSTVFITIWRFIVLRSERWYRRHGGNINWVLIVGTGEMARIVVKKLHQHPELGYRVAGFTAADTQSLRDLNGYPCLGVLDDIGKIITSHSIDEVFISETQLSHFQLLEVVSECEELGILVKMVPTVYDLLIDFADTSDLDGLPLVTVREQPMYEVSLASKRLFDICLSGLILILNLPIMIVVPILIKLGSEGPVIYKQIRAGVGGKPFKMFKFRTMYVDAEKKLEELIDIDQLEEPVFKIKDDPRITKIGKFLRRTSMDEIPQFWNVFIGDMSIVGPRPEETQLVDKYNIWQKRRLKIKPGITGMQQIRCRGTTSLEDRVKYDIYYLRKHSLLMDIWIILKTIPVVLSGKGAF